MNSVLVVEDTASLREVLCAVLASEGFSVTGVESAEAALRALEQREFAMVLSDMKLPGMSGLDFLRESRRKQATMPIVVMTAYGTIDIAVEAMKIGATDFITKPFDPVALCKLIHDVITHRRVLDRNIHGPGQRRRSFVTQSPCVELLLDQARKVAPLSSSVLILGESGTGKELIARYIHEMSPRLEAPFIGVNCGSMPSELLESEFFGHESGAFTGATESRIGLFEVANGGTIFLDEIGNMPNNLQMKLLRTLQESEIKPLGSTRTRKVDVRVISATNTNIEKQMRDAKFREDLYYRLGVVILEIPPLRERREDIALLTNYFLKSFCLEFGLGDTHLSAEAQAKLEAYHWPGNVRELENVLERALIFHGDGCIEPEMLELAKKVPSSADSLEQSLADISHAAQRSAEVEAITMALLETKGNKSKAAKRLGVSYKTLLNKVKEYELEGVADSKSAALPH